MSYNDEPIKNVEKIGFEALKILKKLCNIGLGGASLGCDMYLGTVIFESFD